MQTSWRRHRTHAIATFTFRAAALLGLAAGVIVTLGRNVAALAPCDIEHGDCLAGLLRHDAAVYALPPALGLLAGMIVGTILARALQQMGLGARS